MKELDVLVIDAQGGGLGRQIITAVKKEFPKIIITAVGTNAIATSNMLKAGADHAASGENAVITGCRRADLIIGPIGIVIADALFGEVTPRMARSVGQSAAKRLLIPMPTVNRCDNIVIGAVRLSVDEMLAEITAYLKAEMNQ